MTPTTSLAQAQVKLTQNAEMAIEHGWSDEQAISQLLGSPPLPPNLILSHWSQKDSAKGKNGVQR